MRLSAPRLRSHVALLATLAVAPGCGSPPSSSPGSGSAAGSAARADRPIVPPRGDAIDPGAPDSPTGQLVREAFAGPPPAFPLLSADGNLVAVGIASPVGRSAVATYEVVIFPGWTTAVDVWGSVAQHLPVVDATMAAMLLDHDDGEPAPRPDHATLVANAAAVRGRLDGAFTPIEGPALALGATDTAVGSATIRLTHDAEGTLTLHLLDAAGREPQPPATVAPHPTALVADRACKAMPIARRAWVDRRRKRVVVELGWDPGGEMCPARGPDYGIWPLPDPPAR